MNLTISKKIKYFYWFLTLGIVIFHSYTPKEFELLPTSAFDKAIAVFYQYAAYIIGHISLTFFFFMSGFWLYNNTKTLRDCTVKIKKRLLSLLVPYLIWTLFFAILKIVTHQMTAMEFFGHIYIHMFFTPIIGAAWYILALLVLLVFYPLLFLTSKNKMASFLAFSLIALFFTVKKYFEIPYIFNPQIWWWYDNLLFYLPVYLLGSFLGLSYPDIVLDKEYNKLSHTVIGSFLILLSIILFAIFKERRFFVLFSLILLVGFWLILRNTNFQKDAPKYFNAEFFIYLLHQPLLIPIVRALLQKLLPISTMNGVEMVAIKIVTLVLVVLSSCALRYILHKILPKKAFNLLSGGR